MNNPSLILTDFRPVVEPEARKVAAYRAAEERRHAKLLRAWKHVLSEEGQKKIESMALRHDAVADHYERLLCQA